MYEQLLRGFNNRRIGLLKEMVEGKS